MNCTEFSAGAVAKSDCLVRYLPASAGTLEIDLKSSVAALFGRAVRRTAADVAAEYRAYGKLIIEDDGALDYVVAARVEAVLRLAGLKSAGNTPGAKDSAALRRTPSDPKRLRRSRLYMPGNQPDLPINAGLYGADCVLLDLEDSVAPERKFEARILVRRLLEQSLDFFGSSEIAVRVNPLGGPFGRDDLAGIIPAFPQAVIIPKSESAAQIEDCDREVSRLETEAGLEPGSIHFMPLIETAKGVQCAGAIASASRRNVAVCFGAEDFRRDLGVERSADESETFLARSSIALAAHAAGIGAQDSVFSNIDDMAGLEASTRKAKALGFDGKGIVHPRQIAVVHHVFDPTEAEIAAARRIAGALDLAGKEGRGVASLDGKMIDAPVAARARRLLERASAAAATAGTAAAGSTAMDAVSDRSGKRSEL